MKTGTHQLNKLTGDRKIMNMLKLGTVLRSLTIQTNRCKSILTWLCEVTRYTLCV